MSNLREIGVSYHDGPALDAFGRLRTSSPYTLFDSKMVKSNLPYIWDDAEVSGSGTSSTHNTNQASVTIGVQDNTAGKRVRQTRRHFNYQSGKSQLILLTGVFGVGTDGITRRAGYFNEKNGLFFEQTTNGMSIVVRTYTSGSVVDKVINQNNAAFSTDGVSTWNLDPMDGTGPSEIDLDFTKSQIMWIDFEWLGVGRIRYGWVIDGKIYYCHEVNNANDLSIVYMSTPNLPVRYEIDNDGSGAASTFVQICSTVISEGGEQDTGFPYGVSRGTTPLTTLNDTGIYPLLALKLRSGYEGATVRLIDLSINCPSTATYNFYLMLNPTVTGTALSYATVSDSALEAAVGATNATKVSAPEVTLFTRTTSQGNQGGGVETQLNSDFALGSKINGTSDVLVLGVQRATGTTEDFYGSINWKELK